MLGINIRAELWGLLSPLLNHRLITQPLFLLKIAKLKTFVPLILFSISNAYAIETTVTLQDYYSSNPIIDKKIKAYKVSEGSLSYYGSQLTNQLGQATFELDTSSGEEYVFKTYVKSSVPSYSEKVTNQESLNFKVGSIKITLLDGNANDGSVLADHKLSIQVEKEPGKYSYYASATTDSSGMLVLDLPDISPEKKYRFYGKTLTTQVTKFSTPITAIGDHRFTLGNKPLTLKLVDGLSRQSLANLSVDIYRITLDDKYHWYTRKPANALGEVLLDLDPIVDEKGYIARVKHFNTSFRSNILPLNGQSTFAIGTSRITVKNGNTEALSLLADKDITFYALDSSGKKRWYNRIKTNSEGEIRINLDGISSATPIELSAKSELASNYYYLKVATEGEHQFVVGSKPLKVTLTDALSSQPIASTEIGVYQIDENDRFHWKGKATTDQQGKVNFDLVGLQQGENYRLKTKVFNGSNSYSAIINQAGEFNFAIGSEQITVLNGAEQSTPPLANSSVTFYQVIDGKKKWFNRITTDENGQIRTDLPSLSSETPFILSVKSTINGSTKYSEPLKSSGVNSVVLGNPAVTVLLSNQLSGELYAEQKVTAYRLDSEGKKHWYQRQVTDVNGLAQFDLDGINKGDEFVFSANLFGTGNAYSDPISLSGDVNFQVGALPVTLRERDSQQVIGGKNVYIYEISDENKLSWRGKGVSNQTGEAIFDVKGLSQGKRFVFKAHDVFGEKKYYYGPVVSSAGHVDFSVKKGEGLSLDREDPAIEILLPSSEIANASGFTLSGVATDNSGISKVEISRADIANESLSAQLTSLATGEVEWHVDIPQSWLAADESIELVATAFDFALNDAQSNQGFIVKQDSEDPLLLITSHQSNDQVNSMGFTLEGEVSDDIAVAQVTAELVDPILGSTITDRHVIFNPASGFWAMAVTNGKVSVNQEIHVKFEVIDTSGNASTTEIILNTIEVTQNPIQLVNRITFGLTPDLLTRVKQGDDILTEQLDETTLDDSAVEQEVASMASETLDDVRQQSLYRMIHANKQLREVMTWFWENHFNTSFAAHQNSTFELAENQAFRKYALENFSDLLLASAKSPAMLHYLNNQQNREGRPNENYAREVMELHTLGVNGGYTANDVAELSKIFTGWQEADGEFSFNQDDHDFSDKVILGKVYSGSGVSEGEQVLMDLALHASTADYLCGKLVTFFVSEFGDKTLQVQCAAEFLAQEGEIKPILLVIFNSQSFADAQVAREQVKTPLELMLSIARNYSAAVDVENVHNGLSQLGQPLFSYPVPTGYSESGADWLNSNAVLQRLRMANEIVWQQSHGLTISLANHLVAQGVDTPEAIVAHIADISFGGQLTDIELTTLTSILNEGEAFDIQASNAEIKLQRLLATVISAPAYQMQ